MKSERSEDSIRKASGSFISQIVGSNRLQNVSLARMYFLVIIYSKHIFKMQILGSQVDN